MPSIGEYQMAYGNMSRPSNSKPEAADKKYAFRTGLFATDGKGAAIGSVQVKEDVLIKAGSFINLYENTRKTSDKSPVFNLTVKEGKARAGK